MIKLRSVGKFVKTVFEHPRFQLWAVWAFGPVALVYSAALVGLVILFPWPEELRGKQLEYIGWALLMCMAFLGLSVFFMSEFIKKLSFQMGAVEFEVETSAKQNPEIPADPSEGKDCDGEHGYGPDGGGFPGHDAEAGSGSVRDRRRPRRRDH